MLFGLRHGAPRWLVEALGVNWAAGMVYDLRDVPGFDHVRTYKGRVVVSQTYETTEELGAVLERLRECGIRVRLWGISPYFPGRTFSLVIWRPEDEAFAREIMKRMQKLFVYAQPAKTNEQWT
jgi:hypothetical protein